MKGAISERRLRRWQSLAKSSQRINLKCCGLQPFPSRVRILGHEDIQAPPNRVSSRAAKGGRSGKASRTARRLPAETKVSIPIRKSSARVKKRSPSPRGEEVFLSLTSS